MDLEFEVGEKIWAILDCTISNTRECPTCKQSVTVDFAFKSVDTGTIIGIDIKLRKDQEKELLYTCDFDGTLAESIKNVWKTKAEADAVLDGMVTAIGATPSDPS